MRSSFIFAGLAAAALAAHAPAHAQPQSAAATLRPFGSEAELAQLHFGLMREAADRQRSRPPRPVPPYEPSSWDPHGGSRLPFAVPAEYPGAARGGVAARHGDHLVILRRGRLYTVRIGGGALQPVAAVNAFAPDINPRRTLYDEIHVIGDLVAVVGFHALRGGIELGMFRIDSAGGLAYLSTTLIRADEYRVALARGSRVAAGRLVFFDSRPQRIEVGDVRAGFPSMRRWPQGEEHMRPIVTADRIYRGPGTLRMDDGWMYLHSVIVCDPAGGEPDCRATSVYGPPAQAWHISGTAAYVAVPRAEPEGGTAPGSTLYRLPLDGSAPTALQVRGEPTDEFSFHEGADGYLNVLLRTLPRTDRWFTSTAEYPLVHLRVPRSSFGDGSRAAPPAAYRTLPTPPPGRFENRYVAGWLLYGSAGEADQAPAGGWPLYAYHPARGRAPVELRLPGGVRRIDPAGSLAVVVSEVPGGVEHTEVSLAGTPRVGGTYARPGALEPGTDAFHARAGASGPPLMGVALTGGDASHGMLAGSGSARVVFLTSQGGRLRQAGEVAASAAGRSDDCYAECGEPWFANARPLFVGSRVFALLGYELVEVRTGSRVEEVRRIVFAPPRP